LNLFSLKPTPKCPELEEVWVKRELKRLTVAAKSHNLQANSCGFAAVPVWGLGKSALA